LNALERFQAVYKKLDEALAELRRKATSTHELENWNPEKVRVEKQAMRAALRGDWSRCLDHHASGDTKKQIAAVRKSRLSEVAQDLVINFTLSIHPLASHMF